MPIKSIEEALSKLEEVREFLTGISETPTSTPVEATSFDNLQKLLHSNAWPEAVPSGLIVDSTSEESKMDRAEGICDLMVEQSLKDAKFLDFGCGEGHTTKYAHQQGAHAVGYDLVKAGQLEWETNNPLLTTDFSKIRDRGPYDIVLIYDVLDHLQLDTTEEALAKIKSVCKPESRLYVRLHPWCSRHGGHHYTTLNKAYIHLVFSKQELSQIDIDLADVMPTQKTIHPINNYRKWWENNGFNPVHEDITRTIIEPFFQNTDIVRSRIVENWDESKDPTAKKWPRFQMEQSFIDYVLKLS